METCLNALRKNSLDSLVKPQSEDKINEGNGQEKGTYILNYDSLVASEGGRGIWWGLRVGG